MEIKKYLTENKQTILPILIKNVIFFLIASSLFTIGYVIYRFFFWEAPIDPTSFIVNLSNLTK